MYGDAQKHPEADQRTESFPAKIRAIPGDFMKHAIALTLLIVTVSILGSRDAAACTCKDDGFRKTEAQLVEIVKTGREKALAVFAGTVIGQDMFTITFEVERAWKGAAVKKLTISTSAEKRDGQLGSYSCDYTFKTGEKYLVFANPWKSLSGMRATSCTLTTMWAQANETVRRLDMLAEREKH